MLLRGQENWTEELEADINALWEKDTAANQESLAWGSVYSALAMLRMQTEDGEGLMLGE